jgi:hypothetical protein
MKALDRCQSDVIKVRTWTGPELVVANCYGDFAVRETRGRCEIIHLPSGTAMPASFSTLETAARAMIEISRLRNDWHVFNFRSITPDLRRAVMGAVERHHGIWHPVKELNKIAGALYDKSMRRDRILIDDPRADEVV